MLETYFKPEKKKENINPSYRSSTWVTNALGIFIFVWAKSHKISSIKPFAPVEFHSHYGWLQLINTMMKCHSWEDSFLFFIKNNSLHIDSFYFNIWFKCWSFPIETTVLALVVSVIDNRKVGVKSTNSTTHWSTAQVCRSYFLQVWKLHLSSVHPPNICLVHHPLSIGPSIVHPSIIHLSSIINPSSVHLSFIHHSSIRCPSVHHCLFVCYPSIICLSICPSVIHHHLSIVCLWSIHLLSVHPLSICQSVYYRNYNYYNPWWLDLPDFWELHAFCSKLI